MMNWLNKHSLAFRLSITIIACVCLVFFVLIYFISGRVEKIIHAQINHTAQEAVNAYAGDFNRLTSDVEQIVTNTKNTLSQTRENDVSSLEVVLNSAIQTVENSDLNFTEAWVYTFPAEDVSTGTFYISKYLKNGKIDFSSKKISNFYEAFPWFKEVPKKEKIYWSEPYIDVDTGKAVVTCLIPFKFKDEIDFNGLAALTVDLSTIQKSINNFSFYETGKLLLLSRSGLYVTHPDNNIALKMTIFELSKKINLPELETAGKKMFAGETGNIWIPHSSVYNGPVIFFYTPIKKIGWGLCLVYAQSVLLKPIQRFQIIMTIGLLVGILTLLFIINQICKHSTNQLLQLSKLAEKYGRGDFSESFKETPFSSDIRILAKALSNMRTNILDYTEKERKDAADKQKSQSELEIARNIQKASLSTKYPQHEAFKIATMMIPAREVGGDFYDFFFIDQNHFAVVMADVSGKGIPAALYMMKSQTLIRNISKNNIDIADVFYRVNNELCEGNDTCMFVTVFMAVVDLLKGDVQYVNAGHTPPMLKTQNGYDFMSPKKNLILGISRNTTFAVEKIKLNIGDHLFLYTDGVTEAENAKAKFYGTDRLKKILQKATDDPETNLNLVLSGIKKFVKENAQSDDITMLDFAYLGSSEGRLSLPADNKNLSKMIDFLKTDMAKHCVPQKKQFNVIVAAEEIFSNIANYAYQKDGTVEILTYVHDNIYYVRFSDSGKKYNPLEHKDPDVTLDLKDRKIGGLGIFLAKKLSDTISYSYEKKKNILTIGVHLL